MKSGTTEDSTTGVSVTARVPTAAASTPGATRGTAHMTGGSQHRGCMPGRPRQPLPKAKHQRDYSSTLAETQDNDRLSRPEATVQTQQGRAGVTRRVRVATDGHLLQSRAPSGSPRDRSRCGPSAGARISSLVWEEPAHSTPGQLDSRDLRLLSCAKCSL